jgi:hypothetical protein
MKDSRAIKSKNWSIKYFAGTNISQLVLLTLVGFLYRCTWPLNINDASYEIGLILLTLVEKMVIRIQSSTGLL